MNSADSFPSPSNSSTIFSLPVDSSEPKQPETFLHLIKVTVTNLEEIKVKEKQRVKAGDIISDRHSARSSLLAKKRQLDIGISQASLPLADSEEITQSKFDQERMTLQKTQLDLKQITEKIETYQDFVFKDDQLSEIFEPEKVKELADLQEKQITATLAVKEAIARLKEAQIQHSIQLSNHQRNLEKQKYELESLTGQLQEVNEQLKEIVAIRSPYQGYVYRVRITGQNDRNLTAEIVLIVNK